MTTFGVARSCSALHSGSVDAKRPVDARKVRRFIDVCMAHSVIACGFTFGQFEVRETASDVIGSYRPLCRRATVHLTGNSYTIAPNSAPSFLPWHVAHC